MTITINEELNSLPADVQKDICIRMQAYTGLREDLRQMIDEYYATECEEERVQRRERQTTPDFDDRQQMRFVRDLLEAMHTAMVSESGLPIGVLEAARAILDAITPPEFTLMEEGLTMLSMGVTWFEDPSQSELTATNLRHWLNTKKPRWL